MEKARTRSAKVRLLMVVTVAALAVVLLVGCGQGCSTFTGQDADSLSVIPAADAVLETAANGKIYHYELEDTTRKEALYEDAKLSPQRAANLAGILFEDVYGLNQTGRSILLYYTEKELEDGRVQPRWWAVSEEESAADSFRDAKGSGGICVVDADSGELLMCTYFPTEGELMGCVGSEYLDFLVEQPAPDGEGVFLRVDRENRLFQIYLEQKIAKIRDFLYQAKLYERAPISAVDPVLGEDGLEQYGAYLVTYKDGRQAKVSIAQQECLFRPSSWGEFPGKEFLYHVPEIDLQGDFPEDFRYNSEFFGGLQE